MIVVRSFMLLWLPIPGPSYAVALSWPLVRHVPDRVWDIGARRARQSAADPLYNRIAWRELAETAGRNPQTITTALGASVQFAEDASSGFFCGSPQHIIEGIRRYQEVGVQDFRFDFPSASPDGQLQAMKRFATEIRPQVV